MGSYFWTNGERYVGMWVADQRDGPGTFWNKKGAKFSGNFSNNIKDGEGVTLLPDGSVHQEVWNKGLLVLRKVLI